MPDSLLDALEKAHATLTPAPWFKVGPPWATDSAYINAKSDDPHAGRFVADFDGQWEDEYDDDLYPRPHEDAALIVTLRNSLPALLAYVRAADAMRFAADDVDAFGSVLRSPLQPDDPESREHLKKLHGIYRAMRRAYVSARAELARGIAGGNS